MMPRCFRGLAAFPVRLQAEANKWESGVPLALHSKHVIIDDVSMYIGSQNQYICNLAEWGVVIDSEAETQQLVKEYQSD